MGRPTTKSKQLDVPQNGYAIVYYCDNQKELGHVTVGVGKGRLDFTCDYCDDHLVPLVNEMKLAGHGKTDANINHTVRQIKTL